MNKQVLNVNIIIEENENNFYNLEIVNKNNDTLKNNINKQLLLSNELYKLCSNKLKYEGDSKYTQLIEEFNKEANFLSRRHNKKYPEKKKARVLAGKIIPIPLNQSCEICKINQAIERHHQDYNKPLEVMFLCRLNKQEVKQ